MSQITVGDNLIAEIPGKYWGQELGPLEHHVWRDLIST